MVRFDKAQSGMETYVIMSLIILLFIFSYITYVRRNSDVDWSDSAMNARRECYRLSSVITRTRANGEGYSERLSFSLYNATVFGNTNGVDVEFSMPSGIDDTFYCSFPTTNVTNTTDTVFSVSGEYVVRNGGENIVFVKV